MEVKVFSITALNPGRVVKIETPSYEAVLNYKHEVDDITIVVPSKSCSNEDMKAIKAYCYELDYSFEEEATASGGGQPSTVVDVDGNTSAGEGAATNN